MSADPMHTHKWTVAVRSAASNPLPSHLIDENSSVAGPSTLTSVPNGPQPSTSSGAAAGTRGRGDETDYHKHVGGKDDISHFIRRVQFKLHDSFPQPVRTCDRPPYQVTETGWGEFEVQVKIWWVSESVEKPLQTFHYLKLHPWRPLPVPAAEVAAADSAATNQPADTSMDGQKDAGSISAGADTIAAGSPKSEKEKDHNDGGQGAEFATGEQADGVQASGPADSAAGETTSAATGTTDAAPSAPPKPLLPPVVHSWQYDEVVFPEPTESFFQTLLSHPPTPLPAGATQAFTDPKANGNARMQQGFNVDPSASAASTNPHETPPYPLHAPTSQPFTFGISRQSIQDEADRLDFARIEAVRALETERNKLITAEKELRRVRQRVEGMVGQSK